jgi:hypothetical protein
LFTWESGPKLPTPSLLLSLLLLNAHRTSGLHDEVVGNDDARHTNMCEVQRIKCSSVSHAKNTWETYNKIEGWSYLSLVTIPK